MSDLNPTITALREQLTGLVNAFEANDFQRRPSMVNDIYELLSDNQTLSIYLIKGFIP